MQQADGHLSLYLLEYLFPKYMLPMNNTVTRMENMP